MFADKDKYVTEAYRRKLAEREKQMELERLRELQEEREDVSFPINFLDMIGSCKLRYFLG